MSPIRTIASLFVLVLLCAILSLAGCGSVSSEVAAILPVGHTDADIDAIKNDRDAIRKRLDADALTIARITADDEVLKADDSRLVVEQRQERFFWIAIVSLFVTGALIALSIYAKGFAIFGAPAAIVLRGAAYVTGGLSATAFLCDWLTPYAWWLGLGAALLAVIAVLVWLLHKSTTAKQVMADDWHAMGAELQKHAPDVKARLDTASLAKQAELGLKDHIDSFLKRI